ncbi:hypothetical protein [Campylobacter concisus]|nr:hypothetical protein [Campylobacter concisus]
MPITEAGTHEKVAALVYLSATLTDNGKCAAKAFAEVMANDLPAK